MCRLSTKVAEYVAEESAFVNRCVDMVYRIAFGTQILHYVMDGGAA